MNKQETAEAIKVMQAFVDGEEIQLCEPLSKLDSQVNWRDLTGEPGWVWHKFQYRIAPKPREFWITIEPPGETLTAWSQKPQNVNGETIKVHEDL